MSRRVSTEHMTGCRKELQRWCAELLVGMYIEKW